jgi:hypothetical protein
MTARERRFENRVALHGDNTGSNPVGDANKESTTYGQFRRNFVGTKKARLLLGCSLLARLKILA